MVCFEHHLRYRVLCVVDHHWYFQQLLNWQSLIGTRPVLIGPQSNMSDRRSFSIVWFFGGHLNVRTKQKFLRVVMIRPSQFFEKRPSIEVYLVFSLSGFGTCFRRKVTTIQNIRYWTNRKV